MTKDELENRRGRLLAFVFVLLAGFACAAVVFSFLGANLLSPLQGVPAAARAGIAVLTAGFIALVWEKEREYRRVAETLERQNLLITSFKNRLEVLEAFIAAGDRLNAPLTIDDALEVLLDAAVKLVGAQRGEVVMLSAGEDELSLSSEHSTLQVGEQFADPETVEVPLTVDGRQVALLLLDLPPHRGDRDEIALEVLRNFAEQAARTLETARVMARQRASVAYLQAANLVKSRFLATVSHELRTPLTPIIGCAATLEKHWDRLSEEQRKESVSVIGDEARRLFRVVERILEAARVELHGVTVQPRLHDVRSSVSGALESFLAAEPARLDIALPESAVTAEVDPFVINQAVSNLVDNALRFTEGVVRISLDSYGSSIAITVTDQGPGIDANHLKLLVEPLYRIDDNVQSGTGLGLHIVRTLIGDHHGRLELKSGTGGTTATVILPRNTDVELQARVDPVRRGA